MVIDNDDLDEDILVETIEDLYERRETYIDNMSKSNLHSATNTIVKLIEEEYDITLADAALREYEKNPKTYTLDELMKELDI